MVPGTSSEEGQGRVTCLPTKTRPLGAHLVQAGWVGCHLALGRHGTHFAVNQTWGDDTEMKSPLAYRLVLAMALLVPALVCAEDMKRGEVEIPVSKARITELRDQAEHVERMAKQAWLWSDAEKEKTSAVVLQSIAETMEELTAWKRIAKVAARQGAIAKEMQQAWLQLYQAKAKGQKRNLVLKGKGRNIAADVDPPFGKLESTTVAEGDAWKAWEEARAELDKTTGPYFEAALRELEGDKQESSTSSGPTPKLSTHPPNPVTKPTNFPLSVPKHTWWCATNFHDRSDQVCRSTRKDCESMDSVTSTYMDCREHDVVTLLQFTQINGGQYLMAFPLLSQCERRRKALMKNKVDYRDFSKCHSSDAYFP